MVNPITVCVPASTSNLGSGFDTLSASLSLYLKVRVKIIEGNNIEWVSGQGPGTIFPTDNNLIERALVATLKLFGARPPGLMISMENSIPLQRGLGSSGAAIIAGIKIAESLCEESLSPETVFELAYPLEGHPDNLAASLFGGWALSRVSNGKMYAEKVPSSLSCRFVLAIPEQVVSTLEARNILPESYSLPDVVHNLQRCALLVHALHSGTESLLREATSDHLHQCYRASMVPGMEQLLDRKGLSQNTTQSVLAVFISGSGSAVVALANDHFQEIGQWMVNTFLDQGSKASYQVLDLDSEGARVLTDRK